MSSARDDKRAFAWIEQRLALEDRGLAGRADGLKQQFGDPAGDGRRTCERSDEDPVAKIARRPVEVAVVLTLVATVGPLLTAVLSASDGGGRRSARPTGSLRRGPRSSLMTGSESALP
ncbi:hypothetical protein [Streptomyces viridochromogenes]|nr:hypothetical protein [Streptomyces viridochromogenes]